MKHFIALIAFALGVKSLYAQHLSYLGIPIDKNIEVFSNCLIEKGFMFIDDKKNSYSFVGTVLNDTVFTIVDYSYKSKTVYRVCQIRSIKSRLLRDAYHSSMKKLYLKKYGDNVSEKSGDDLLIITEKGEEIGYIGFQQFDHNDRYSLTITFSDDKNNELNDKEKIGDL